MRVSGRKLIYGDTLMLTTLKKNLNTSQFVRWFDAWGLFVASLVLVAFIPVYPKLPLFDIIPGYIVRVRIEDLLVFSTILLYIIQLQRKKISLKSPITPWIGWYTVAGFCSLVSGLLIVGSIPIEPLHIAKSFLHYLRYIEYFSLFFILFTAVKSKLHAKILTGILLAGLLIIGMYGVGQRYWYWPVYSTMNREFSKGIRLYLTEHARVQSTFGGHYDLAAYLVIMLPIVLMLALLSKKRSISLALWALFTLGVWLITVSASRTSFAAFVVCAVLAVGLSSLRFSSIRERIMYSSLKGMFVLSIIGVMFWSFGADIRERLLQTLAGYPVAHGVYTSLANYTTETGYAALNLLPETLKPTAPPVDSISTEEMEAMVSSDQQPTTSKPGSTAPRPTDVYSDIPDIVAQATISATGTTELIYVEQPRTYSEAALKHGLSLAIRLDTLWPRALQGFYNDPLFGSGYATLTKATVTQFTEAESTDNNYLRTLGETGLFGFITFYGAVLTSAFFAWKLAMSQKLKENGEFSTALGFGFICATVGLLLNAVYIDVFASSKVAFVYWAFAGIVIALWRLEQKSIKDTSQ